MKAPCIVMNLRRTFIPISIDESIDILAKRIWMRIQNLCVCSNSDSVGIWRGGQDVREKPLEDYQISRYDLWIGPPREFNDAVAVGKEMQVSCCHSIRPLPWAMAIRRCEASAARTG